jgi:hypothetical protein
MKKGYIYKIYSSNTNRVYIGSTFKLLGVRLYEHIESYEYAKRIKKKTNLCSSYEVIREGDYDIEEVYSGILSLKQLEEKETYYIHQHQPYAVNKKMPVASHKPTYQYKTSWGGDYRFNNNFLSIDLDVFL